MNLDIFDYIDDDEFVDEYSWKCEECGVIGYSDSECCCDYNESEEDKED